jgi:hypothetical protein
MSEDTGRQVPYHRSGGGALSGKLAVASLLAMAAPAIAASGGLNRPLSDFDNFGRQEPINTGRRAEKDAIALSKAQAKRERKAAKRAKAAS